MLSQSLNAIYVPLRLCYGIIPIVAGADKFTNLLTDWSKYLPDFMTKAVPVSPHTFMMAVGAIEIIAGLAVGHYAGQGTCHALAASCVWNTR